MSALIPLKRTADRILALQASDGAIPWVEGGIWDPWNHGESVMALAVAGRIDGAIRGLEALFDRQEEDGGWTGELGAGVPLDESNRRLVVDKPATARDTNFAGYASVTVLRTALALGQPELLERFGERVANAMNFVLSCQTDEGDIVWRKPELHEEIDTVDSLRAGNACLYKSLECAIRINALVGKQTSRLETARLRLAEALHDKNWRFDRKSTDRRRYAMDWYYPVLAGVHSREESLRRIKAGWMRYVVDGLGCRCVADEPWVTAAETAELALACLSVGLRDQARQLIIDLEPLAAKDGGYWMGWQYKESILWPYERPSWTSAAVILAADALEKLAPGHDLLVTHLSGPMPTAGAARPPAT